MTVSRGLGTYGDGAGVVTPTDHKLAHLGLVAKTGAGTNAIRPGLFFDGVSNIVTGTANMSYNVAPFTAVSSRGPGLGAVFFANDGVVNVATTAAPGSNSRIDVVYVWQREFALDGGSTAPVIGVVQGTPAASPTVPSLSAFPGALELARITVPAGVTATNSGTTITQTAPFTSAAGAPFPVRNVAALPASSVPGTRVRTIDTGVTFEWSGSAWVIPPIGLRQVLVFTSSGSFVKANYPWLRAVRARVQAGGGGGGATAATANRGGGGGGGGGYCERFITDIAGLADSVAITVGAGGAAGVGGSGGNGGNSSAFGATATGGGGGASAGTEPNGGPGGSASGTVDVRFSGSGGGVGSLTVPAGGAGGSSHLGGGALAAFRSGTGASNGPSGLEYGGGGGGGRTSGAVAADGGAGAPGVVILELYA